MNFRKCRQNLTILFLFLAMASRQRTNFFYRGYFVNLYLTMNLKLRNYIKMKKYPELFLLMFVLSIISLSSGCTKEPSNNNSSGPGTNEIWMQNGAFNPQSITVAANSTVTWSNRDGTAHTVTSTTGPSYDSGNIVNAGTYAHQFTTAGTYFYRCSLHPAMTGTVVVQ